MTFHESPPLVIYDLDGVITSKDTFTAILVDQLSRSPLKLVRAMPTVLSWLYTKDLERRHSAARRIASIALQDVGKKQYEVIVRCLGKRLANDPRWIRQDIVSRIQKQHAAGAEVIVATASEEMLARTVLAHASVPYHYLSASALVTTGTGIRIGDHKVGRRKVTALLDAGIDVNMAEFVTDSLSDLPTARVARKTLLVGASIRTTRRFKEEGINVSTWDE